MHHNTPINLAEVEKVALALGELNDDMIYVGGAVVGFYAQDEGAEPVRPTKDIDLSVKVSTYAQMEVLREKLAAKGIYPAVTETVLYRYVYQGILIDFIPYDETPLGPTNRWLKPGFARAIPFKIGEIEIRILPVSLFLATKWEAYNNRGGDPRMSHDFEDIIYILDNCVQVVDDVAQADELVKVYLRNMSNEVLNDPYHIEVIECHLNPYARLERRTMIIEKLQKIRASE